MLWLALLSAVSLGTSAGSSVGQGRVSVGTLDVSSAELDAEGGGLRLGALGEFFRQNNFPMPPAENLRTAGTLSLSFVPTSFVEIFASYSATSNVNSTSAPRLIQALGDVSLGIKWARQGPRGLFWGLQLTGHSYAGVGEQNVRQMALGVTPLLLLSGNLNSLARPLPLRWHLNVGSHFDNTSRLVEGMSLNTAEEFALNIQRYPQFLTQAAVEMPFRRFTPFLEYKLAYPLWVPRGKLTTPDGASVAVSEAFPQRFAMGVKAQLIDGVGLLGAADFGLRRKTAMGVPATPAWNVFFGAQFTLAPPRAALPSRAVPAEKPKEYTTLTGVVRDAQSQTPIENAIVLFEAQEAWRVATGSKGEFQSHALPHGKWRISVEKSGYERQSRDVNLEGTTPFQADFALEPVVQTTRFLITVRADQMPRPAKVTFVGEEPFVFNVPAKQEASRIALPPGRYRVDVLADGFYPQSRDIQSSEGTDMHLVFELKPAPKAEKEWVVVTEKKIETLRSVHFETGTARIHTDSLLLLQAVVQAILKNDIKKLRIEGHTDNQGGKARNMKLSQERAQAVAKYLIEGGVEPSRLETAGFGGTRPVAPNLTARARELNRRVEFVILSR